jgi:hypothetical protein
MWILVLWSKDVRSQNKYGTDLLTWGQIEVNCGIVGASAMFLRPLFRDFFQRKENKLDVVNREAPERQGIEMKGREASVASSEIIIGGQTDVPEERSRTG